MVIVAGHCPFYWRAKDAANPFITLVILEEIAKKWPT